MNLCECEAASRAFRLRKKPMNLYVCDSEERDHVDECEDVNRKEKNQIILTNIFYSNFKSYFKPFQGLET